MRLVRLTPDYPIADFDCGDSDLNDFLFEDAKPFLEKRVANTFILEDEGQIAAYFCLLNDKVSSRLMPIFQPSLFIATMVSKN